MDEKPRIDLSILPKRYRDIESDHIKDFGDVLSLSLFLAGGPGTGKTVLACSLAKKVMAQGGKVKFVSYPAFIMQLQDSFRDDSERPFNIAKQLGRFDGTLIIDDLGAEKLSEYVRQITYFLLNEREQWCLPVIITSNFSLSELNDQVDPRISSRIAGMCKVVKMAGKDKRIG